MMISLIALCLMGVSTYLVLANLRPLAQDTAEALRAASQQARQTGRLLSNISFAMLWLMIFALSYF